MRNKLRMVPLLILILALAFVPNRHGYAENITVDTINDVLDAAGNCDDVTIASLPGPDGFTSLREAICATNNRAGPDTIGFDIPGLGARTILPFSKLPPITDDGTTIDGYTQPGAALATASAPATILIELSGVTAGVNNGLELVSANNVIRGLAIKSFTLNGIAIGTSAATGNVVSGNYIGVNWSGTVDAGNGFDGVFITQGAMNNLIGGDEPAERNVIGGNDYEGVAIHGSGTMSNTVSGNYIGLAADGITPVGNAQYAGVRIYGGAQNNVIGGEIPGERNVISGNDQDGVRIVGAGTTGNVVLGNYIGTDAEGLAAVNNGQNGVHVAGGAQHNTIGGESAPARNVISGNHNDGVLISDSGTMSNTVSGNYIGTDVNGIADLGNIYFGVEILNGATNNLIGGEAAGARNLLSGNDDCGAAICGAGTTNNILSGNYIGTDASGTIALGNTYYGVYICLGAQNNTVGGNTPGERNVVSGNSQGIYITDENTSGNVVAGNYVGLDASGTADLGNTVSGIIVGSDAQNNTIGGATTGDRNVISGNDRHGVQIGNPGTAFNVVTGNYIGTDASGMAILANDRNGIDLYNSTHDNIIGPGNLIAGSGEDGIEISGSDNNTVFGNTIGTNARGTLNLGNTGNGVFIWLGDDNTVGPGNVIANNQIAGVGVRSATAIGNAITQNRIFTNDGLGIDLIDGANGDIAAPVITDTFLGPLQVEGTACTGCTVEVFGNSTTDGEGEYYLGSTLADGGGAFNLPLTSLPYPYLTATATDTTDGTSEFSAVFPATVISLFLPVVIK